MKKHLIAHKNSFLIILFISLIFAPFIGTRSLGVMYSTEKQNFTINSNAIASVLSQPIIERNINSKLQNIDKFSIFDDSLKSYLTNLSLLEKYVSKDVKIIIMFGEGTSKQERLKALDSMFDDYKLLSNYDIIPGAYLECNPYELIEKEIYIKQHASIKMVFKSKTYTTPIINDNTPQLSSLNKTKYSNWWISATGADILDYDGSGVRVAVIDSGIYEHPDLNVLNSSNFVSDETSVEDLNGHGTHVAGIIGSNGNGSSGKYRGVAPGCDLINARAGNSLGSLIDGDIIKAIEWCSKPEPKGGAGADIISMSFGGGFPDPYDPITQAIDKATSKGVICVASAGNSGPGYFTGSTPAAGTRVIAVGATDASNNLAYFSSWGPTFSYLGYPDVVAPGVDIISTEAKGSVLSKEKRYIGDYFDFYGDADYIPLSGTSMSCPMVSGALAILKQAFPKLSPETAKIALLEGATKLSNNGEADIIKSGAGLINVSASFDYLLKFNKSNVNNIAKIYPDNLPIKPYDLLHFPGDSQKFGLTVISGKMNTFNISVPSNISGIYLSLDRLNISFSGADVDFVSLKIEIEKDAVPGYRNFRINLTNNGIIYDHVDVSLEIRLPEHRILMESYHGMNDLFPEFSFYQMGFYDAMNDITEKNIAIDYAMEYWTPDYDVNTNNSLLTEERLAQYDAIVLQAPILPFSPLEIDNIKSYFNAGGNILFLGTRYQDLCTENLNYLFSELDLGIQIKEQNIISETWVGLGAMVSTLSITEFDSPSIFNDVNEFLWYYGNCFTTSENQSIAKIYGETVAAIYNSTSTTKGHFVAFGDLHWMFDEYNSSGYSQDHNKLLNNLIDYLLPKDDISINIGLNSERSSNSQVNISVYVKNQTTGLPLEKGQLNSFLNITVKNIDYSKIINFNSSIDGIVINDTYNFPHTSPIPYNIEVNLTIGTTSSHKKMSKFLFFNATETPEILYISVNKLNVTRAKGQSINLIARLDNSTYNVSAYMTIYSASFYNTMMSINKTFILNDNGGGYYDSDFIPSRSDPSGYAIFYILPLNVSSNYTNPKSPREYFPILNYNPEIVTSNSTFRYGDSDKILFDDTQQDGNTMIYSVYQGYNFDFEVKVNDTLSYEDKSSEMRVFVNLLMCSITSDGYLAIIYPSTFVVVELKYNSSTGKHQGNLTIPELMLYDTINRTQKISTEADYNEGYVGILYVSVFDSEGGYIDFIIVLSITKESESLDLFLFLTILIIIISTIAAVAIIIIYLKRRKSAKFKDFGTIPHEQPVAPSGNEDRSAIFLKG